ncbi:hypothetical protein [Mycobacterium spongiae]|nr:hypothetical protein [Mycobacterium spongiae]
MVYLRDNTITRGDITTTALGIEKTGHWSRKAFVAQRSGVSD